MFVKWELPSGRRATARSKARGNLKVRAVIRREPAPAKLLDRCPAGSWGRDKASGDRWVCFERAKVCPELAKVLPWVEKDLRAAGLAGRREGIGQLLVQGAYHRGWPDSAGTHDRGGVIDFKPILGSEKGLRILRKWGFAAWYRGTFRIKHVHAVLVGCRHLTGLAAGQVDAYRAGLDGLAGRGRDTGPRPARILTWREALREYAD
jgi:hypothetical protein